MSKKITDYKELEQKLLNLGHTEKTAGAVTAAIASIEHYGLSDSEKYAAYSLLSATGFEALEALPSAVSDAEWGPFDYGNVGVGDYARVKKDAYTAESAVNHNGKVGRIISASGGRFTLEYIGLDTGRGMPHPMAKLESIKRV